MKLDESIELKNKQKMNMIEMNNQQMRSIMEELYLNETMKDCLYEVLTNEGFLPDTLSEGETYEGVLTTMMEDDDIMAEMYKSCMMNESDCGLKMEGWLQEKLIGNQSKLDMNKNGELDSQDFKILNKSEKNLDEITKDERYERVVFLQGDEADEPLDILDTMGQDAAMEYLQQWHYPGQHEGSNELGHGSSDKTYEKDGYIMSWNSRIGYIGLEYDTEYGKGNNDVQEDKTIKDKFKKEYGKDGESIYYATANKQDRDPETFEKISEEDYSEGADYSQKIIQICNDLSDIKNMISTKDELPSWVQDKLAVMYHSADAINSYFSGEKQDDIDPLNEEENKPIKGKNVDSENKSNANKENKEAIKSAEDSQETTEEKVDNLKNQKYENTDWEKDVDEVLHGFRNNLDLDYKTSISKEKADQIKDQAMGLAPKDHVNVDHDSEAGEKLINSAKKRSEDEFITNDDYTSKHDRTQIEKGQSYEKTTVFNESIQNELNRLKNLFKYEEKLISENRKKTENEDLILFKQVSKKKDI